MISQSISDKLRNVKLREMEEISLLTTNRVLVGSKFGVNGCTVIYTSTSVIVEEWATVDSCLITAESSSNVETLRRTTCMWPNSEVSHAPFPSLIYILTETVAVSIIVRCTRVC